MTMRARLAALCLSTPLAFGAPMAQAETLIDGSDPEAIRAIASGYGSATLETDSEGDPQIVGRIDGTQYIVLFYGCTNGANCNSIQLTAGWSGVAVSLSQINGWNSGMRFGKAYLDEDGDPTIEMNVNLDFGVSRDNLDDTFDFWRLVLSQFEEEVLD
ncbi:YbjN domain-containing protein [Thioclava pacifica]|uniref:YbjN domain-containing protein n=1 Tax=Thioclava pacifica DSM 10166 TaxID=1353537 RepID=A0A074J5W7_9RHOB|nr:YbjN domain-containing protein [Thioclava pacifica]KEO51909.1 hypothetical protein TP2_10550 [Thioclava pacifica DSM 10166]